MSHTARQRWMAVLARTSAAELAARLDAAVSALPAYRLLRGPEAGLVMLRGRAGGAGEKFNLGEMTVTRCTVRTAAGQVGHATVTGRDRRQAELAALADALLQDPDWRDRLEAALIMPLARAQQERRAQIARKAAATRVDFFTMRTMRTTQ